MLVAGDAGTILQTVDGGATWNAVSSGTTSDLHDFCLLTTATVVAAGSAGTVLKTTDAGDTWALLATGTSANLLAIDGGGSAQLTAVGEGGLVLRSTNSGATWVQQWSPTSADLLDVLATSANVQIAVGRGGVVIRTDDGGAPPIVGVEAVPLGAGRPLTSFPNPFRAATTIRWTLGEPLAVRLTVHDAAGREVARLLDGAATAGDHSLAWDGRDARGASVRSGVYFYRLQAGTRVWGGRVVRVE
jgi:hypothetical protein